MIETVGTWVAFALTLLIFSLLLGDNPLYRLGLHILIGVSLGYALVVGWTTVLVPKLIVPLLAGSLQQRLVALVPLVLGMLLLTKASPRLGGLGNVAVAFLIGVGAAIAVGGAVLGTLLPQTAATAASLNPMPLAERGSAAWIALWTLIGTITTLLAFTFSTRSPWQEGGASTGPARLFGIAGRVGRIFLMVAFGSLYAGALIATIAVLVDRVAFVLRALGVVS